MVELLKIKGALDKCPRCGFGSVNWRDLSKKDPDDSYYAVIFYCPQCDWEVILHIP